MIEIIIYLVLLLFFGTISIIFYLSFVQKFYGTQNIGSDPVIQSLYVLNYLIPILLYLVSISHKLKQLISMKITQEDGYGWVMVVGLYLVGFIFLAYLFSGIIHFCSAFVIDNINTGHKRQGESNHASVYILIGCTMALTLLMQMGFITMLDYFMPFDELNYIN